MEGIGAFGAVLIVIVAALYLLAPLKLFGIHSELQKIRKLLEAQDKRAQEKPIAMPKAAYDLPQASGDLGL